MSSNTEVVLSVISLISVFTSGYFLYKTNISKDKIKADETLLGAESAFRSELMESIKKMKDEIDSLKNENIHLRVQLECAQNKIDELSNALEEKLDKINVIGTFLKHIPNPAWLKTLDHVDGKFKISTANSQYCYLFNVSEEYCKGQSEHPGMNADSRVILNKLTQDVIKYKNGIRTILPLEINGRIWHLLKFPVIENNVVVGVGGILTDCG